MIFRKNEPIDIVAIFVYETERAFLIDHEGDKKIWLPKSLVEHNDDGTFTMPEWLAMERELI